MTKVLITGAAGFIGFHLYRQLQLQGLNVIGIDNFNEYYDVNLKKARANQLDNIISCDIRDKIQLLECISNYKPDIIIHLAAIAGVRHSLEFPNQYIDNNISGTQNLIDVCETVGIEKVIYASTSCIMTGNELPWNEKSTIKHQINPYGYSKFINECQFLMSKIPVTVGLRFFTVYGPWGRPDMATFGFTKNIIENKPIIVFNNGDMIRDFTYIDDIINGISIVVNSNITTKEIFNIGRGQPVTLLDFISTIEKSLNKKALIEFHPKHPADTYATLADTTKLQAIGYKPKVDINEGVERFVSWYKSFYKV